MLADVARLRVPFVLQLSNALFEDHRLLSEVRQLRDTRRVVWVHPRTGRTTPPSQPDPSRTGKRLETRRRVLRKGNRGSRTDPVSSFPSGPNLLLLEEPGDNLPVTRDHWSLLASTRLDWTDVGGRVSSGPLYPGGTSPARN